MLDQLSSYSRLFAKQAFEIGEVFGFETRNKYRICDEAGADLAFVAEQQKSLVGILLRQMLGHWRSFELHFFDSRRRPFLVASHPFRWFFQRVELREVSGRPIGVVERHFSLLTKHFKVHDPHGRVLLEVASPVWRLWTFAFLQRGRERARVSKKWSGLGYELLTDRDNFLIEYSDPSLSNDERALVLAAAIYIDLMYFERKGSGGLIKMD